MQEHDCAPPPPSALPLPPSSRPPESWGISGTELN